MADSTNQVFTPGSFQELFSTWNRFDKASLFAGGVEIIREQGKIVPVFPGDVISLHKMEELGKIRRTERYLEIGAMVKLSQIANLGKIVPEALRDCISHIADPQLRNLATIGGNICNPSRRLDASAPMIILDAQYELRTAQSARWISASRFSSLPGPPVLAPQEILTRVRVPLEPWTYTWYRKFNTSDSNRPGGLIILIMRIQKNVLSNIRVIYSDRIILRDKNSETMLAGKHLPLERKDTKVFVDRWKTYMSAFQGIENSVFSGTGVNFNPELIKTQILNFIESTLMYISD
ncbi:MAG: FAD binding domain-containing protein [Treponema sp.]|jgi:CO/xanthine dehydrogenase FAD-binding subunit|nr:FAD binding domain-containing protein [Treponema sp.]